MAMVMTAAAPGGSVAMDKTAQTEALAAKEVTALASAPPEETVPRGAMRRNPVAAGKEATRE